jgi:hypothetical protein
MRSQSLRDCVKLVMVVVSDLAPKSRKTIATISSALIRPRCRRRRSKRPKVLGGYVGAGGLRDEGVHFPRGNWSLGSIRIRRIEQPRSSECRQFLDNSSKRPILNFLFNLFAWVSEPPAERERAAEKERGEGAR